MSSIFRILLSGAFCLSSSSAIACGLLELTSKELDLVLRENASPIVIVFCSVWATHCPTYLKTTNDVACKQPNTAFLKLELDANTDKAQELSIRHLPTTLIFRNRKEVRRVIGAISSEKLESILRQNGIYAD